MIEELVEFGELVKVNFGDNEIPIRKLARQFIQRNKRQRKKGNTRNMCEKLNVTETRCGIASMLDIMCYICPILVLYRQIHNICQFFPENLIYHFRLF